MKGKTATFEVISEAGMELPRFDYERFNMSGEYRFVYAVSIDPQRRKGFYSQLVKVDVQTGKSQVWCEEECYPGEPVFVGAPGREAEDDGVILSVVLDARKRGSFLLILDARSFMERAKAEIPKPILFGYHGAYFGGA